MNSSNLFQFIMEIHGFLQLTMVGGGGGGFALI